ncbi:N-acetylmuramoyl-L-alanine amidase [Streptomyces sp. NPDC052496]|uniref:LysM peptidoglycan-binding domain-containing protein n=1 Tax=Streptomyces sp. NPDC052496 TaxID=3154951 RepID=UPI0034382175
MSAASLLAVLKDEGLHVVQVGNWRTHNRAGHGDWGPVHGVMIHHTVTSGTDATVRICYDGYASLPGPLCHGVIAKNGWVHLVGCGRANHAGRGDRDVLNAVIAERPLPADNETNADGNVHFYGFECENRGDGRDPWPAVQLEAVEAVSAAICRFHRWSERSVIGHREWQPGKVDPLGFTMASMRARIAERLAPLRTYRVRAGDTLSSIAAQLLGSLARWPEIARLNGLKGADVIRVGQVLKIPKR